MPIHVQITQPHQIRAIEIFSVLTDSSHFSEFLQVSQSGSHTRSCSNGPFFPSCYTELVFSHSIIFLMSSSLVLKEMIKS